MFGWRRGGELKRPPIASRREALEVLRVWMLPDGRLQFVVKPRWNDPAEWGLSLADVARHAAKAYAVEGRDEAEAFRRICSGLEAELNAPTDAPVQLEP